MTSGAASLGEQLLGKGWRQGVLLEAPAATTLNRLRPGALAAWETETVPRDGALVLATQTCDLVRDKAREPSVEFLRAFWTADKQTIAEARKNSVRHFLLRTEQRDGVFHGLVADASARMFVDKESLLLVEAAPGCDGPAVQRRFQSWLARRYDRPAIATELVRAIHKPVVEGLRAERKTASRAWTLLEGVAEARYALEEAGGPPYLVAVYFVPEDGTKHPPISAADAEELGAWFISTIGQRGEARVVRWDLWPLDEVSVADYLATTPLALDEFSL
jgi:hypothetical protein